MNESCVCSVVLFVSLCAVRFACLPFQCSLLWCLLLDDQVPCVLGTVMICCCCSSCCWRCCWCCSCCNCCCCTLGYLKSPWAPNGYKVDGPVYETTRVHKANLLIIPMTDQKRRTREIDTPNRWNSHTCDELWLMHCLTKWISRSRHTRRAWNMNPTSATHDLDSHK